MLYYCKNHQKDFVPDIIKKDLKQYKFVFNPSFVFSNTNQYWAFRCYCERRKEILSIIYIYDELLSSILIYDLNPIFKDKYNLKPADPKLFKIEDKVYCTLNSGFSADSENSIFLIRFAQNLDIKRCIIPKRSMVEKNWAFFEQGGKIKMLYSVSPICKIYRLASINSEEMFFEEEIEVRNDLHSLSIGTQPIVNDDKLYLIGHRKYSVLNKRLYLGVPIVIDMKTWSVKKGSAFLVHSLASMLGSRFRFNKNLISCTYISGLHIDFINKQAKITYGINDITWNNIQVELKDLW